MIVPGGGISLDGTRWIPCRPGFLLPVRVLSRLFRRLFLTALADAHAASRLAFFAAAIQRIAGTGPEYPSVGSPRQVRALRGYSSA